MASGQYSRAAVCQHIHCRESCSVSRCLWRTMQVRRITWHAQELVCFICDSLLHPVRPEHLKLHQIMHLEPSR